MKLRDVLKRLQKRAGFLIGKKGAINNSFIPPSPACA
jgi:hypothetical protein